MHLTTPDAFMITGKNPVQRLRFSNGIRHCDSARRTASSLSNRGYVGARELCADDRVRSLDLPAPAVAGAGSHPDLVRLDGVSVEGRS